MTSCQWAHTTTNHQQLIGKPLAARTKNTRLAALRSFFIDCQEWGWIPRRFDPRRSFATPRAIRARLHQASAGGCPCRRNIRSGFRSEGLLA